MKNKTLQQGLTIIELVTVIVLLAIVSVFVVPKFSGSSSYEAYSYRPPLISALRLTQQRAMQHTAAEYQNSDGSNITLCHHLVLNNDKYGVPDKTDCAVRTFASDWQPDATGAEVDNKHQVTFSVVGITNPATIGFNHLGQPTDDCTGGCIIAITSAEDTVQIQIESEGYIHAL